MAVLRAAYTHTSETKMYFTHWSMMPSPPNTLSPSTSQKVTVRSLWPVMPAFRVSGLCRWGCEQAKGGERGVVMPATGPPTRRPTVHSPTHLPVALGVLGEHCRAVVFGVGLHSDHGTGDDDHRNDEVVKRLGKTAVRYLIELWCRGGGRGRGGGEWRGEPVRVAREGASPGGAARRPSKAQKKGMGGRSPAW